jgi:hypothetical protein
MFIQGVDATTRIEEYDKEMQVKEEAVKQLESEMIKNNYIGKDGNPDLSRNSGQGGEGEFKGFMQSDQEMPNLILHDNVTTQSEYNFGGGPRPKNLAKMPDEISGELEIDDDITETKIREIQEKYGIKIGVKKRVLDKDREKRLSEKRLQNSKG